MAPRRKRRNDLNDLTGKEWIKFTRTWFVGGEFHAGGFEDTGSWWDVRGSE